MGGAEVRVINKLKKLSLREASVRASQAGAVYLERLNLGLRGPFVEVRWPRPYKSSEEVFLAFQSAVPQIPGLLDPLSTATLLTDAMRSAAVKAADAILENRFTLFGGTEFDFGNPPNWHLEPRAGIVTPRHHWSRIAYLNPAVAGDKKIVWELNRQQFLIALARAFVITGDERYASAIVGHIKAWSADNPYRLGINWASALEVAFRTIAWLWAIFLAKSSRHFEPDFIFLVLGQLRINGRHISKYLSTYFSPNTHLTGEALALYYLGVMLPFLPEAKLWRESGRRILLQQLHRQVLPDGTYFENATYYHRYTLDIFLHAAVLARSVGEPLEAASLASIERLAHALMQQIRPDGTHGYFGDDDGGRLLPLDECKLNDFRPALCNAAALFGRADFKACAGPAAEDTIWLLGKKGTEDYAMIPSDQKPSVSHALRDAGLFVMRDGGGPQANQLLIDCGPHGALNCGHAHADALAFELVANGRSLLMDAGTFTYTGDANARRAFRSTAYHNALTVDEKSSSEPLGPFSWGSVAQCRLHEWWSSEQIDVFEGSHDGYRRLADPVDCRRSIIFVKGGYWILRDRASGASSHDFAQHFHFAPSATPEVVNGGIVCREVASGSPALEIAAFSAGGSWSIEDGWISTRYTDRRRAKVAVFSVPAQVSADIVCFLIPRKAKIPIDENLPLAVEAIEGRAFIWQSSRRALDLFAVREGKAIATGRATCDGDWMWIRWCDGVLETLLLRDAKTMTLDGRRLLTAPAPVGLSIWKQKSDLHVVFYGDAAELDLSKFSGQLVVGGRRLVMNGTRVVHFEGGQPRT